MGTKRMLLVLALFSSLVLAQQPPPSQPQPPSAPPAGGGQPASPAPTPTRPTQPTQPTQPRNLPQQQQTPEDQFARGRGVSGRIIPSPGTRVQVELYLDSMRVDSTFSDLDGQFRFEHLTVSARRYEVHIEVGPGKEYVEEVDFSFSQPVMIYIRPQGIRDTAFGAETKDKRAGTLISLASLQVPKTAAKEFEKAHQARGKKKFDEALTRLQKATEIYPKYAEAFNEMGLVYRNQNQSTEAQKAFEQAIAADPDWVAAYLNLAQLQLASNQMQPLLETSNRLLRLDPMLAPAHFFQSVAYFSMGRADEAEKAALEADRHEHSQVPQLHLLLARIYQKRGQSADYAKQLRAFLKESPDAANAAKIKAELEQTKDK